MGACTATIRKRSPGRATGQEVIADIALSTSYATGGDSLSPATLGLPDISIIEGGVHTTPSGHHVEVIYPAAPTGAILLRVRNVTTGAELTAATNNATESIRVEAVSNPAFV